MRANQSAIKGRTGNKKRLREKTRKIEKVAPAISLSEKE